MITNVVARSRVGVWIASLALACAGEAGQPNISSITPLSIRVGGETEVTISGDDLLGATNLWLSVAAEIVPIETRSGMARFKIRLPAIQPAGIGAFRLSGTNGVSDFHLVLLEERTVGLTVETNRSPEHAQPIAVGDAVQGVIPETESRFFVCEARRGQKLAFEVVASRAGSLLDPVLRILTPEGRELAYCDDDPLRSPDSLIEYAFKSSGRALIELRDIRYQGGPHYSYQLRVSESAPAPLTFLPISVQSFHAGTGNEQSTEESEPNDSIPQANPLEPAARLRGFFQSASDRDYFAFEVQEGERWAFLARTRTLGFACDAVFRLLDREGKPLGATNAFAYEGTLTNRFKTAGQYFLEVTELNHRYGSTSSYEIEMGKVMPGFTLTVATDRVNASADGEMALAVTANRFECDAPITLSLEGLEGMVVLTNNVMRQGKTNSITLKAKLSDQLKPGTFKTFRVTGRAELKTGDITNVASTMPALRKLFPQILYPPRELDSLIALGVSSGPASQVPAKTDPE